jgi:hypothetical protein
VGNVVGDDLAVNPPAPLSPAEYALVAADMGMVDERELGRLLDGSAHGAYEGQRTEVAAWIAEIELSEMEDAAAG